MMLTLLCSDIYYIVAYKTVCSRVHITFSKRHFNSTDMQDTCKYMLINAHTCMHHANYLFLSEIAFYSFIYASI